MGGNPFGRSRLYVLGPERRRLSFDDTVSFGVSGTGFGRLTCEGRTRWVCGQFAEHFTFPAGTRKVTVVLRGVRGRAAVTVLFSPEWRMSSVRNAPHARIELPRGRRAPNFHMPVPRHRLPPLALRRDAGGARLRELYDELATH